MLHYLIQVVAFQLLFLIGFELFLKKETFFNYNRAYLLITPVLAMLLPLLKIPFLQAAIPAENFVILPEVLIGASSESPVTLNSETPEAVQTINWWLLAYSGGFIFSLGIFFNKFRVLKQLFSHKPVRQNHGIKIVEVPQSKIACTFYKTIFLGAELSEKEREQILSHELVHVEQNHTLDLLLFEFLKIIFWFNPLIYIYQSKISAIHEYIADAGVVKNVKKQDYFQQLLNSAFNTEDISFVNQFFNHSIIKKRIVMLQKNKSRSTSKFKFLIILPLMAVMLTYVSCSSTQAPNKEVTAPETPQPPSTPSSVVVTEGQKNLDPSLPIPFAVVEQIPLFPGCEELKTMEEQKECMTRNINMHVNKNFNVGLGKELGLTGIHRIYVQFKVSKKGEVIEVRSRAPHPDLGAEAERVVNDLPDMEPAIHGGKEVAVLYSLPITFQIAEPEPKEEGNEEDKN
ncbi:M56 family metallopeptidase [Salinimicrobium sp. TH3]|uniref:M56 family metallopeptidase n=1 Tax=Salinimicrobium sp. TH3 TaxID=2997342 RepID=UPI002273BF01|nr:M56 family metallopeptidase [Salinimicrobium sp. TH3]MCY2686144.1 M56 family metallopeptidase [Salinimicrobium sp. TH3]